MAIEYWAVGAGGAEVLVRARTSELHSSTGEKGEASLEEQWDRSEGTQNLKEKVLFSLLWREMLRRMRNMWR